MVPGCPFPLQESGFKLKGRDFMQVCSFHNVSFTDFYVVFICPPLKSGCNTV